MAMALDMDMDDGTLGCVWVVVVVVGIPGGGAASSAAAGRGSIVADSLGFSFRLLVFFFWAGQASLHGNNRPTSIRRR